MHQAGRPLDDMAFWAAGDLGNLAGKSVATVAHPTRKSEKTGRAIKVPGAVPDLTETAIIIPDSVTDLVLLGDSTSDPFETRNAMARAAARYGRPGRTVRVAWAPDGVDFDDLLRTAKGDEVASAAALERIAGIIDAATEDDVAIPDTIHLEEEVDPATLAQAERKFGLEQLNAGLAQIRAAEGDDRAPLLSAIAEQLGQLAAAGAIVEQLRQGLARGRRRRRRPDPRHGRKGRQGRDRRRPEAWQEIAPGSDRGATRRFFSGAWSTSR
jgi:hypothetical protein